MTKKQYIAVGVAAVVVLGGFFLYQRGGNRAEITADGVPAEVQIVKPSAYVIENGARARELKTGDKLIAPVTVEVSKDGRANIYFPDGSTARLAGGTTITLREGMYDRTSGKLTARITLAAGKVWSKIVLLATPDSMWRVETTHAVATVRGTAFGMETDGKKSRVTGSEHTVDVAPVDPKTNEPIEDRSFRMSEDEKMEIGPDEAAAAADGNNLAVDRMTAEDKNDTWVKENEAADGAVDGLLEDIAAEGAGKTPEEFRDVLIDRMELLREGTPTSSAPAAGTDGSGGSQGGSSSGASAIAALKIVSRSPLDAVTEGDKIAFRAFAVRSDFSETDVTASVRWQVLGGIGSIDAVGNFTAKLAPDVMELGESFGSVTATWINPASGAPFLGKSAIFRVHAAFPSAPIAPQG